MTQLTPCQEPDRDPDDWFIESNGKQYKDEPVLTQEERDNAPEGDLIAAEREKIRTNLIKRRKAKESCFECPVRLQCLDVRLNSPVGYAGTWGGYYPEQIAQIESARAARRARRT